MVRQLLKKIRKIKKNIYNYFFKIIYKNSATFLGNGQRFFPGARIVLKRGSSKHDILIHDCCEVFGGLVSINKGKIIMHEYSKIGKHSTITAVNKVEIGRDTAISYYVTIIDNNNHPINPDDRRYMRRTPHGSVERSAHMSANAPIIIGENVLVGAYSRICKGVTIGDNAIIAANSVVTHDVPANAIAAGNPARIVKYDIDKTTKSIFPIKK